MMNQKIETLFDQLFFEKSFGYWHLIKLECHFDGSLSFISCFSFFH
jgi:hypothetical protein